MNFKLGIILALIGAVFAPMSGNWLAMLWAIAAGGWAISGYIAEKQAKRYKALALARRPWLEIGTVQRTDTGGYEVWNGKVWVKA